MSTTPFPGLILWSFRLLASTAGYAVPSTLAATSVNECGFGRSSRCRAAVRAAVEVRADDEPQVIFLARHLPCVPREVVDFKSGLARRFKLRPPALGPSDGGPVATRHLAELAGQKAGVAVVGKREGDDADAPVPKHLHERLGEAAVPLGHRDDFPEALFPDDAVDPLDPAAGVPREAVRLRGPDPFGGARRRDEDVVQVDGGEARREEDLDRDRGGEPDAQISLRG